MSDRLFGTDGIRAPAGEFPLDRGSLRTLGEALVLLLRESGLEPRILIGRDTRESGSWMEEALFQGMLEEGGLPVSAGIIPTSAVSYLTCKFGFASGIVISASHNAFGDNGVKIFSSDGYKVSTGWEERLEAAIRNPRKKTKPGKPEIRADMNLVADYAGFLKRRLSRAGARRRIKVVLDCANGAASAVAPGIMEDLGFEVAAINAGPDGTNINRDCGSLHPEGLAGEVVRARADIGIAYDGDADRALWVDETGRILNGDHTLYVQASFMRGSGRLRSGQVVATTMSNMGLEKALERMGIELVRTRVGDKYVLEEMISRGANLGGEQSGHTIFLDDCPTGDGILTSLKMLEAMSGRDCSLSSLVEGLEEYPQVLINVPVMGKPDFGEFPEIVEAVASVRKLLGGEGRFDLRYSGTEPLARVMVEGGDGALVARCAGDLAGAVRKCLGSGS